MGKDIRISKGLFNALYRYHICEEQSDEAFIKRELEDKMYRNAKRILYSQHKTGETEEARQNAITIYQELQKR